MPRFHNIDVTARCEDCDWESFTKNSHGIGVQHHRRTGHTVHIEQEQGFTYATEDSEFCRNWKERRTEREG